MLWACRRSDANFRSASRRSNSGHVDVGGPWILEAASLLRAGARLQVMVLLFVRASDHVHRDHRGGHSGECAVAEEGASHASYGMQCMRIAQAWIRDTTRSADDARRPRRWLDLMYASGPCTHG
jgi:hypothetical protein